MLLSRDVVFREDERWDWITISNSSSMYTWDDVFPDEQDNGVSGGASQEIGAHSLIDQSDSPQPSSTSEFNTQGPNDHGEEPKDVPAKRYS